ncbi:MAG: branched-chain amino acid ABC transporter permease [Armatimonadota bacterium]|nr:MAG: branched-chain amino acid ABC transporter permease [Armatimonadota bacterium]
MSIWSQILQYTFSGLTLGSIYAIIALGFTIIYNATEIINFAQGEFVMLGAMIMVSLHVVFGLPVWLAFPLSVGAVTVVGCLLERLALRSLRGSSILTMIIVTIGASIFLRGVAMTIWGRNAVLMPPISSRDAFFVGQASIMPQSLWVLCVTVFLVVGLAVFYSRTLVGKAMRAVAINRYGAQLVGISPSRMVFWSFALSAGLGATAGILIAPITMAVYNMGTMLGLKGFAAAIFGGLGSSGGAILAGVILGLLESFAGGFISSGYKDAVAFLILLGVLLLKPTGMLGGKVDAK